MAILDVCLGSISTSVRQTTVKVLLLGSVIAWTQYALADQPGVRRIRGDVAANINSNAQSDRVDKVERFLVMYCEGGVSEPTGSNNVVCRHGQPFAKVLQIVLDDYAAWLAEDRKKSEDAERKRTADDLEGLGRTIDDLKAQLTELSKRLRALEQR